MSSRRRRRLGQLPLTEKQLREGPDGDLFGWSLDVGMGGTFGVGTAGFLDPQHRRRPARRRRPPSRWVITPALEVGLLSSPAEESRLGAAFVRRGRTDPCDGPTQGPPG